MHGKWCVSSFLLVESLRTGKNDTNLAMRVELKPAMLFMAGVLLLDFYVRSCKICIWHSQPSLHPLTSPLITLRKHNLKRPIHTYKPYPLPAD